GARRDFDGGVPLHPGRGPAPAARAAVVAAAGGAVGPGADRHLLRHGGGHRHHSLAVHTEAVVAVVSRCRRGPVGADGATAAAAMGGGGHHARCRQGPMAGTVTSPRIGSGMGVWHVIYCRTCPFPTARRAWYAFTRP